MKTEDGGGVITDIENNSSVIPENFILYQNYPNPFNPNTIISYELQVTGFIKLAVFDLQGREIETLVNQKQDAGKYEIKFDGSGIASGVYYYQFKTDGYVETKKMMLVR